MLILVDSIYFVFSLVAVFFVVFLVLIFSWLAMFAEGLKIVFLGVVFVGILLAMVKPREGVL